MNFQLKYHVILLIYSLLSYAHNLTSFFFFPAKMGNSNALTQHTTCVQNLFDHWIVRFPDLYSWLRLITLLVNVTTYFVKRNSIFPPHYVKIESYSYSYSTQNLLNHKKIKRKTKIEKMEQCCGTKRRERKKLRQNQEIKWGISPSLYICMTTHILTPLY